MTFDDGILTIYTVSNSAETGNKPIYTLTEKSKHYYGVDTLGFSRYYTALEANQQIECVVNIPLWHNIVPMDICVLENGIQYMLRLIQPMADDQGLKITKLTLERISGAYAI